jgi:hypothetical protein
LITLLDENRQWFKSSLGIDFTETRDISFCQHTIMSEEVYEVNNALENEVLLIILLTGCPGIRFYAGVIQDANGFTLGSLCVIDTNQEHFLINRKMH